MPNDIHLRAFALLAWTVIVMLAETTAAATTVFEPGGGGRREEVAVRWNGKVHPLDALPAEMGEPATKAAGAWTGWAVERGYRVWLTDDTRVLLVLPAKKKTRRPFALIEETCEAFDELLPAPERPEPEDAAPPEEPPESPRDEDGDGEADEAWSYSFSWMDGAPLDTETAVLIQTRNVKDYLACLERVAELEPYLEGWVPQASSMTGFVLERPLVAAWIEDAPGMQEWDVENELVHRLASLLLVRRFGQIPYWLHLGTCWYLEDQVRKGIWCFPYRRGFVWATEHGDWDKRLAAVWSDRTGAASIVDLTGWARGSYDETRALESLGTARFLARDHREAYPLLLEDLRLHRIEHGVDRHEDGTWNLIPNWEVPAVDQRSIFEGRCGKSFLTALGDSFRGGKAKKTRGRR